MEARDDGGHAVVGGTNYGQGSSREHAALAPRFLGMKVAIVQDFARIHWQNLANFGVLPLTFVNESDWEEISQGDTLVFTGLRDKIRAGNELEVEVKGKDKKIKVEHALSERQIEIMETGGLINWVKDRLENK